jgi:5-methylthioadenosine/S-adenosylhomocysteine deaminase
MQRAYAGRKVLSGQTLLADHAIVVRDGNIEAVVPKDSPRLQGIGVEDWGSVVIVPGTVNTHTHSFQSLVRGISDDLPFFRWRDEGIYRISPHLGPDEIYAGALLTFGEMLRYGVTTVADFFYVHGGGNDNDEAVIRAARDLGIRLVLARTMYDWGGAPAAYQETVNEAVRRCEALLDRYAGDPMVAICPAPHSPHAASPEMIQAGARLAEAAGTRWHIHVAEGRYEVEMISREHGRPPLHWLDRLGVVSDRMVAVHCVWLVEDEIRVMGAREVKLAYCPASNMFLGDGVTNIPLMLAAGVTIGLGTDGPCSNNRASVFDEMRTASLLQKLSTLSGETLPAETALAMGTKNGGLVLGLPVGEIAPGYRADLVALNLDDLSLLPPGPVLKHLVHALHPAAIARVVVAGRTVVERGHLLTVPESEIAAQTGRVTADGRLLIKADEYRR